MMTQSEHGSDDLVGVARAQRTPRRALRSRVSSGHVVMVVAGLLGLLLSLSVLRKADNTVAVVMVARDLAPGTRLLPDMVRTTRIHADDRLLHEPRQSRRFRRGQGLGRPRVAPQRRPPRAQRSRPGIDAARGASRELPRRRGARRRRTAFCRRPHRRARASANDGSGSGYVLAGVDVVAVHSSGTGPLRGSDGKLSITVAVDAAGAQRLAAALHVADLLVVRSTGAAPVAPVPWFVPGGRDG